MNHDYILPRMPVPELSVTLNRYLAGCKPVVPSQQYDYTCRLVEDFLRPGGEGERLQKELLQYAESQENWATSLWLDDMYLRNPVPLQINSNPFFLFPKQQFKCGTDYLRFAAKLICFALSFKDKIESHSLPQEYSAGHPLCMNTYYHFFRAIRQPGSEKDIIHIYDETAKHITVACKNQFYILHLGDTKNDIKEDILVEKLGAIVQMSKDQEQREPPIGLLTTQNRRCWAGTYHKLQKSGVNKHSLNMLESSLFLLCLDEPLTSKPNYSSIRRESINLEVETMASHILHGGGSDFNSGNRWFDKFLQFVVSRDGVCGLVVEHSVSEGITVVRFMHDFLTYIETPPPDETCQSTVFIQSPIKLNWELSDDILCTINDAEKKMNRLVSDLDLYILRFSDYGRQFIKSNKMSPDAYIQLALQLTYYKVHRKLVSTYESASLRAFHLGRVDNIRAATSEALKWSQAMCDESQDVSKIQLFQDAVRKQTEVLHYTVKGEGPDIHLVGLKEMAKSAGHLPALFLDRSYQEFMNFRLSTSQVPSDKAILVGYGPVISDGYGCCYNPQNHYIDFCVSSFFSAQETSSDFFALSLEGSLLQMRELCLKASEQQGRKKEELITASV
ncbi:choline O-acetyltransferase-like isoform X2 [Limulus polyphemus]|uniref:Choline O-acetyltransferase n=1 Tax=Limulus polyphemus TaxID=6850 RepID=A0ABM1S4X7_LIMPO|nr:choline O-acetyltransferase-like isoform X2 [Limulus polyphemus]